MEDFGAVTENGSIPIKEPSHNDKARMWLIGICGGAIGLFMICIAILYIFNKPISELKDLATITLSPLITLFGTMTGFYFGSEKR